jgi:hypothetical protein
MASGGKRVGAGRKPVHEEQKARELCQSAIINKYGSLEAGIEFLLMTEEPALLKFAFEHAIGKPVDKVEQNITGLTLVEEKPSELDEPI